MKAFFVALALGAAAMAQDTFIRKVEGELDAWSCSGSPEYYKGEGLKGGVDFVQDPERGQVLRCRFGFGDPEKSEPIFLNRKLDPQPPRLDVLAVRFQAKLTAPVIDSKGGFILRLRTSDTAHDNWNVQELLGRPFPVGEWVQVEIPTAPGAKARNIWGKVFGHVREMTFRLDDIDDRNGTAELLLANIELALARPPTEEPYAPNIVARPANRHPRVLLLRHGAAGHYRLPEALRAVASDAEIDEFLYRGRHFEFFGMAKEREAFLVYDAIVLLDIDPFVLTNAQASGIADAVASGASLLAFGGTTSFSDAKAMPAPLRDAFPVTFSLTKNASKATVTPTPGPEHALNAGFDANWLGRIACRQPLAPKPGTDIPWTAGDLPMVVAGTYHQGRTVVVNAQAQYLALGDEDLFLSPLGDDLVRRLMAHALRREPSEGIRRLRIEPVPVGGGTIVGTVQGGPVLRVLLDGMPVPVGPDHTFSLELPAPEEVAETHQLRIEAWDGKACMDQRDLPLVVRHPLEFRTDWTRNRSCFVPGAQVELSLALRAADVPRIVAGPRTEIRYLDRWPLSLDSFADIWLLREGKSYHNQRGPSDVQVATKTGIRPSYQVSGIAHAARPGENTTYAADDRVLDCQRTIACLPAGMVEVRNEFKTRQDLQVQRLPLTISLPVDTYVGLPYRFLSGTTASEGRFPPEPAKGRLFDGKGGTLEIETPDGPLRVEVADSAIRFWCQDLRVHNMTAFRLEIEAPLPTGPVARGTTYEIPVRIQGPAGNAGTETPATDQIAFSAHLRNADGRTVWEIPRVPGTEEIRFAGSLPDLPPGRYELLAAAGTAAGALVTRRDACLVVEPLRKQGFYPTMCYLDLMADGHCLDSEGIRAHLREMREAGFNTVAMSAPTSLASEQPSPGRDLRARAERTATELGMALTFEYSSFTTYRRDTTPSPCPFTPEAKAAVEACLAPQVDIANRTARLLTAKVIDEPHLSLSHVDWTCPHCQAEFRRLYGIECKDTEGSKEPYALWCRADFAGRLVEELFRLGAEYKAANATGNWDLLLTYMAMGLGYENPQRTVQDALDWTRHAGWADFDVYPYFYPTSQRIRMVQASYAMSYMREVARARNVPWGFYVELDDRNWPFQKNPKEASAECAFTAVAHGADYLNTFIHRLAATGCGARPERWELAKEAFRQIERLGPRLASLPVPRSRLALLHPNAHERINNGYQRPDHTLELLKGVFGDIDVLPEQLVCESGDIPYAALLLLDAEYLHADAVAPLQRWLAQGGVLLCDRLPTRTHRNQPIIWQASPPDARRTRAVGRGRIAFLPENPETDLQALAEAPALDAPALNAKVQRLADWIEAAAGAMPIRIAVRDLAATEPSADTVVVGLRGHAAERLVTVVNHRPVAVEATIRLRDPVAWRYRDALAAGEAVPARPGTLVLEIPAHGHRVLSGQAPGRSLR